MIIHHIMIIIPVRKEQFKARLQAESEREDRAQMVQFNFQ
jgi:hypothetical protein